MAETAARVAAFEQSLKDVEGLGIMQSQIGAAGGAMAMAARMFGMAASIDQTQANSTIGIEDAEPGSLQLTAQRAPEGRAGVWRRQHQHASGGALMSSAMSGFSLILSGDQDKIAAVNDKVVAALEGIDGLANVTSNLAGGSVILRVDGQPAVEYSADVESRDAMGMSARPRPRCRPCCLPASQPARGSPRRSRRRRSGCPARRVDQHHRRLRGDGDHLPLPGRQRRGRRRRRAAATRLRQGGRGRRRGAARWTAPRTRVRPRPRRTLVGAEPGSAEEGGPAGGLGVVGEWSRTRRPGCGSRRRSRARRPGPRARTRGPGVGEAATRTPRPVGGSSANPVRGSTARSVPT